MLVEIAPVVGAVIAAASTVGLIFSILSHKRRYPQGKKHYQHTKKLRERTAILHKLGLVDTAYLRLLELEEVETNEEAERHHWLLYEKDNNLLIIINRTTLRTEFLNK